MWLEFRFEGFKRVMLSLVTFRLKGSGFRVKGLGFRV